ncbi:unnamed protein product [Haemonchus placei]|uniref:CAP-Gly domain-containing protein n=1 Tax=Haemonchus placei TaxID=6290 RepID=A0A158QNU7_HAEPC|nr:unnamed protein product [Haemonchus placei]
MWLYSVLDEVEVRGHGNDTVVQETPREEPVHPRCPVVFQHPTLSSSLASYRLWKNLVQKHFMGMSQSLTEQLELMEKASSEVETHAVDTSVIELINWPVSGFRANNTAAVVTSQDIGSFVSVSGVGKGVLHYVGEVHGKDGLYCGIELDTPTGKHNGTYQDYADVRASV